MWHAIKPNISQIYLIFTSFGSIKHNKLIFTHIFLQQKAHNRIFIKTVGVQSQHLPEPSKFYINFICEIGDIWSVCFKWLIFLFCCCTFDLEKSTFRIEFLGHYWCYSFILPPSYFYVLNVVNVLNVLLDVFCI